MAEHLPFSKESNSVTWETSLLKSGEPESSMTLSGVLTQHGLGDWMTKGIVTLPASCATTEGLEYTVLSLVYAASR